MCADLKSLWSMHPVDDLHDLAKGSASKRKFIFGFLADLFGLRPDPYPDGFGQTMIEDIRYYLRFRKCRQMQVRWRRPLPDEVATWNAHLLVSRFADDLLGLAEVDGRAWIVKDRMRSGWPDPPEYCFFVMDGHQVWAVADFDRWPKNWMLPPITAPADQ
jgi:hypothetical protein